MEGTRHRKPQPWLTRATGEPRRPGTLAQETPLQVAGRRYYTPSLGRWLSRDPIGERGGINHLCFVMNRPATEWDRLGLSVSSNLDDPDCKARLERSLLTPREPHSLDNCLDACDSCRWCTWRRKHDCYCSCWAKFAPNLRGKSDTQLIREWEALHAPERWRPGDMVHHTVPLADGGADSGANIEPLSPLDHLRHHRGEGDFRRWGRRSARRCRPADPLDME